MQSDKYLVASCCWTGPIWASHHKTRCASARNAPRGALTPLLGRVRVQGLHVDFGVAGPAALHRDHGLPALGPAPGLALSSEELCSVSGGGVLRLGSWRTGEPPKKDTRRVSKKHAARRKGAGGSCVAFCFCFFVKLGVGHYLIGECSKQEE